VSGKRFNVVRQDSRQIRPGRPTDNDCLPTTPRKSVLSIRIIKLSTFAKPVVDERSSSSIALLQSDCPKMLRAVAAGASTAAALVIVVRLRFFFFKQRI